MPEVTAGCDIAPPFPVPIVFPEVDALVLMREASDERTPFRPAAAWQQDRYFRCRTGRLFCLVTSGT
jgi:hypothetical protein